MAVLVLAESIREANAWKTSRGVRHARYAASPGLVSGVVEEIVELPSWKTVRNRHAINAAVKSYLRRRPNVTKRLDADWDFAAYKDQRVAELERAAFEAATGDPVARRNILVDAANEAVEALAADMGLTPEQLLVTTLDTGVERVDLTDTEQALVDELKAERAKRAAATELLVIASKQVEERKEDPTVLQKRVEKTLGADTPAAKVAKKAVPKKSADAPLPPATKARATKNAAKPPTVAAPLEF